MSSVITNSIASPDSAFLGLVPPLQSGDHLTRAEFERRYKASPAHIKAELIEGIVYIMTPVSEPGHARPHLRFGTWLGTYEIHTSGTIGGDNGSIRMDMDNMPQPDAYLRIEFGCGGQSKLGEDEKYVEGAPDLVAEVAASSASYDLHEKLRVYRRNGVSRIHRLAGLGPCPGLVSACRRSIRPATAGCSRITQEQRLSRPLARCGRGAVQ